MLKKLITGTAVAVLMLAPQAATEADPPPLRDDVMAALAFSNEGDHRMNKLKNDVRAEIEDVHRFFVHWFTGAIGKEALEPSFGVRMHPNVHITSPDGNTLDRSALLGRFAQAHANNPAVRIDIRNVKIVHEGVDTLLVSYEEWQTGAASSEKSGTARISTALLSKQQPFVWFNIHETWLPDAVVSADPFDF